MAQLKNVIMISRTYVHPMATLIRDFSTKNSTRQKNIIFQMWAKAFTPFFVYFSVFNG